MSKKNKNRKGKLNLKAVSGGSLNIRGDSVIADRTNDNIRTTNINVREYKPVPTFIQLDMV